MMKFYFLQVKKNIFIPEFLQNLNQEKKDLLKETHLIKDYLIKIFSIFCAYVLNLKSVFLNNKQKQP